MTERTPEEHLSDVELAEKAAEAVQTPAVPVVPDVDGEAREGRVTDDDGSSPEHIEGE